MESGAIVIDEHATIRPGATIVGPAYIGPHVTILERALIKAHTAIGPWCKVSGEIGGTIFQGFANKGHDGHLGDSWIGEWVNLGAGTNNSNLLNTYTEVFAKAPDGVNERTGLQFLGAIIGDHVKTAISTRIMTGAILQTGGMFAQAAAVAGTTPRFAWSTDAGLRTFRIDKFLETARAMMTRRNVALSDAGEALLRSLATAETP
jgi:UDP-N-acetylglucosamine diphosphorylase/glucosamine-1-phosphate N-acetyltransferase